MSRRLKTPLKIHGKEQLVRRMREQCLNKVREERSRRLQHSREAFGSEEMDRELRTIVHSEIQSLNGNEEDVEFFRKLEERLIAELKADAEALTREFEKAEQFDNESLNYYASMFASKHAPTPTVTPTPSGCLEPDFEAAALRREQQHEWQAMRRQGEEGEAMNVSSPRRHGIWDAPSPYPSPARRASGRSDPFATDGSSTTAESPFPYASPHEAPLSEPSSGSFYGHGQGHGFGETEFEFSGAHGISSVEGQSSGHTLQAGMQSVMAMPRAEGQIASHNVQRNPFIMQPQGSHHGHFQ